jgi:hypothetical protein
MIIVSGGGVTNVVKYAYLGRVVTGFAIRAEQCTVTILLCGNVGRSLRGGICGLGE